jgi:hypothetical protein
MLPDNYCPYYLQYKMFTFDWNDSRVLAISPGFLFAIWSMLKKSREKRNASKNKKGNSKYTVICESANSTHFSYYSECLFIFCKGGRLYDCSVSVHMQTFSGIYEWFIPGLIAYKLCSSIFHSNIYSCVEFKGGSSRFHGVLWHQCL